MKTYVMTAYVEDEMHFYSLNSRSFNPEKHLYPFRLVDDDGEVMGYGLSNDASNFDPLDNFMDVWGCTAIEYWNPVSEVWEGL